MNKYMGYVSVDSSMPGDKLSEDGFIHESDIWANSEKEALEMLSTEFFVKNPHRSYSNGKYQMQVSW